MDIYQQLRQEMVQLKQKYPSLLRGKPGDVLYIDDDGYLCAAIKERTNNNLAGIEIGEGNIAVRGVVAIGGDVTESGIYHKQ